MLNRLKLSLALAAAALLCACASMPSTTYDASSLTIETVAVAPVGMPSKADVRILNSVGANFGLIGALVEEGRAASARGELEDVFAQTGYDYKKAISTALVGAVSAAGFQVQELPGTRIEGEHAKFLRKLPADVSADAILDAYVQYVGFVAAGSTTDYRPAFEVAVRMVNTKDGKVVFQDQFVYAASRPTYQKAIVVPSVSDTTFANREALRTDAAATRDALHKAIEAVSAEVTRQFN